MPILALVAFAALVAFEVRKAHGGSSAVPTYTSALLPGAQPFLPPIAAPDDVRIAYANAMFRKNPIEMVQLAQQINAQYPQYRMLAVQLSQSYQELTNNPIPGIAAAGVSLVGARGLDPRTIQTLALMNRRRRARGQNPNVARALVQLRARNYARLS